MWASEELFQYAYWAPPTLLIHVFVTFQSRGLERMVRLLVKVGFTPPTLLYSRPAEDSGLLGFPRVVSCAFALVSSSSSSSSSLVLPGAEAAGAAENVNSGVVFRWGTIILVLQS